MRYKISYVTREIATTMEYTNKKDMLSDYIGVISHTNNIHSLKAFKLLKNGTYKDITTKLNDFIGD